MKCPLLVSDSEIDIEAIKLGTDKSSLANKYTSIYEYYFSSIKDKSIRILELGIAPGAKSLKLWSSYFSNADIFGIDCDSKCTEHVIDRVHIYIGNLTDDKFMQSTLNAIGGRFDIIIDDASHKQPQVSHSLQTLWPHLNNGGLYIIEDLHTSYLPSFGMSYRQPGTVVEELKDLVDALHVDTYKKTPQSAVYELLGASTVQESLDQFEQSLYSIHFYKGMCFLFKE